MSIEVAGFEVEREIGRGGFGVVYRARQLAFNRPAAIKVLLPGLSADELQKRFTQECRAVGALRPHPNVLTVYSTGLTADGRPYLAMQYLGGGSLSERLPLTPEATVALGLRLADGLAVAHAGGVIHRDVKPSNILFGDDGEPVLVDFGISSLLGDASTTTGEVALSIGYTPPEILGGSRATVAADVYALGATLFASVCGRTPFVTPDGFTSIAVMAARILSQPVEDLRPEGVPDALCEVIERCMAKEPGERYDSMAHVRAALAPLAADDSTIRTPSELWGLPVVPVHEAEAATQPRRTFLSRVGGTRRRVVASAAALVVLGGGVATAATVTGDDSAPTAAHAGGSRTHTASSGSPSSRAPQGSTSPSAHTTPHTNTPRRTVVVSGRTVVVGGGYADGGTGGGTGGGTSNGTAGGGTGDGAGGGAGGGTTRKAVDPVSNHGPVFGSLPDRRNGELFSPAGRISASDPDGDALRYTFSNLPPGVTGSSSGVIGGTIGPSAVRLTTDYRNRRSGTWRVTVLATDPSGAAAKASFVWTVVDDHFVMPNYYGKYGCNDDPAQPNCHESVPNISSLGPHGSYCRVNAAYKDRIVAQSVTAGSAATWGQRFVYTYAEATCP